MTMGTRPTAWAVVLQVTSFERITTDTQGEVPTKIVAPLCTPVALMVNKVPPAGVPPVGLTLLILKLKISNGK